MGLDLLDQTVDNHSLLQDTKRWKFQQLPYSAIPKMLLDENLVILGFLIPLVLFIFYLVLQREDKINHSSLTFFALSFSVASGEKESNVLRKVASLTYDLAMEQKQVGSSKMRSPPERYDLSCIENFEGTNIK